MTVGFDAPLPPAPTGVADYAATLLRALRKRGDVQVSPRRANVFLYHLGNNQLHRNIYLRALARPGVVVLHDAVLQHFFLGSMTESEYVEEFVHNYGEWKRDMAMEFWRKRASSALDSRYFGWPMLKRIAETSRAVIVHNPAAARAVREHAPNAPVFEIPHLFEPPPPVPLHETLRLRHAWGAGARDAVFGVFGFLRESKRLFTILRAFRGMQRARLLIAGRFVSSDLQRAVSPLPRGVIRLGYLEHRDFHLAASAVDVCINLRYPAAGETSGIAIRMMGIGKPVMLTSTLETSRYPEGSCFRIEPGPEEQTELSAYALLAAEYPEIAREIGARAAAHIRRRHNLEQAADQYWSVLRSV